MHQHLFDDIIDMLDTLNIRSPSESTLETHSIWGALRGLESFSQMLVLAGDGLSVSRY